MLKATGWAQSSHDGWRRSQLVSSRDGVVAVLNADADALPANAVLGRFLADLIYKNSFKWI